MAIDLTNLLKRVFAVLTIICIVCMACLLNSIRFARVQDEIEPQLLRDPLTNRAGESDIKSSDTQKSDRRNTDTSIQMPDIYVEATGLTLDELQEFSFAKRIDTYPRNGTGTFVNVSKDFDPDVFNSFCKGEDGLLCVMPVYSAVDRFESRQSLRQSLGKLVTKKKCKLFFVVGTTTDESLKVTLQEEYTRERDILVSSWIDTYRDLNNKAFTMIQWISKHCMNVPFVVHSIDDVYINLAYFLERLKDIENKKAYYMIGPKSMNPTLRIHFHSSVTVQEYPYPRFPTYAYGWGYAFPSRVAERLLAHAFDARYCWIEDVWIGGHVRISANVRMFPICRKNWKVTKDLEEYDKEIPDYNVLHGVNDELLNKFYTNAAEMADTL